MTQEELIAKYKQTFIHYAHSWWRHNLYEFCWSESCQKCVEATSEQIENLEHLCRDILEPIESHFGVVTITQGIRDLEVYNKLAELHEKHPDIYSLPSRTSHHFTGNAVDFKHSEMPKIFEWCVQQGLPTRELRLYRYHIHAASFPVEMKKIKDCR